MLNRKEVFFIEKLVSSFTHLGVSEVPFSDELFYKGVFNMGETLKVILADRKETYNSLGVLFLKRPVSGVYERMVDGLMNLNGRSLSFALKNPYWEKATITLSTYEAENLLEDTSELDISKAEMIRVAEAFCKGAGVSI